MLIVDAHVVTLDQDRLVIPHGALLIRGDRIADLGRTASLSARYPEESRLDAGGMIAMPGLICAHTHLYRRLARGLDPAGALTLSSVGRLTDFWWKLACALEYQEIRYSALACCIEAVRAGTTTLFAHHVSPRVVRYSLDAATEAVLQVGVRASLCYGANDRLGQANGREGVEENARFAQRVRGQPLLGAAMGLGSCMYLSEETLRAAVGAAALANLGYHVISGESAFEVRGCVQRWGVHALEAYNRWGVLGKRTVVAHGVHLSPDEERLAGRTGTWIAHNPRSNMLEAVGRAPVGRYLERGIRVCLGTDGISHSMLQEIQSAYLLHRQVGGERDSLSVAQVTEIALQNNAALASHLLHDTLGELTAGALADVILVDYVAPTPLDADTLSAHLVWGLDGARVDTTIVGGRVLMRHGALTTVDEEAAMARSRELARDLWRRLD